MNCFCRKSTQASHILFPRAWILSALYSYMSRDNHDHSRNRLFSFRPPPIRDNNPWTFVSLGSNPTSGLCTSPRPKRPHLLGNRHTAIKFVFPSWGSCWNACVDKLTWAGHELSTNYWSDLMAPLQWKPINIDHGTRPQTGLISELVSGPHTIWHNAHGDHKNISYSCWSSAVILKHFSLKFLSLLSFWRINVSICVYFKTLPRHSL